MGRCVGEDCEIEWRLRMINKIEWKSMWERDEKEGIRIKKKEMKNDLIDKREFLIDIRRLNKEREGEERIERWEIENDIINERIIKEEGKINKEEEGVVENILIEIDGIESCKKWEEIMDCRIEEIRGMGGRKDIGWNERIVDEENIV